MFISTTTFQYDIANQLITSKVILCSLSTLCSLALKMDFGINIK